MPRPGCATLINDLLTFSRVIRSSEPFVSVDLGAVTAEVLGDLEVRIEKSGAKIELGELADHRRRCDADAPALCSTSLSNALKFQPAGPLR